MTPGAPCCHHSTLLSQSESPPPPTQGRQLLDSNSWPAGNCQAVPPHGASHVTLRLRGDVARYEGLVRCQRGPREDPKSPREGGQWPYQEELVC